MLCSIALAVGLGVGLTYAQAPLAQGLTSSSSSSSSSSNYVTTAKGTVVWQPPVGSTYQIVLSSAVKISDSATSTNPNVDIFEIDMFGNTPTTITKLHNLGKKVICYFSAGSYEPYRPDANQFQPSDLGNGMVGWPDEKWIDISSTSVRSIMAARIQMAASKGCDAVDPDNMDGYVSHSDVMDWTTLLIDIGHNYRFQFDPARGHQLHGFPILPSSKLQHVYWAEERWRNHPRCHECGTVLHCRVLCPVLRMHHLRPIHSGRQACLLHTVPSWGAEHPGRHTI